MEDDALILALKKLGKIMNEKPKDRMFMEDETLYMTKSEAPKEDFDPINKPKHYAAGKIEPIEAIEDWKLGFNLGNSIKYIARAGKKDKAKEKEDLQKALFYLSREIANMDKAK